MAALIGMPRAAWRRQPSGMVTINNDHPLAYRCVDAFIPNEPIISARGINGGKSLFPLVSEQPGKIFQQLTDAAQDARVSYGYLPQYQITGPLTLFCRFYINTIPLTTNRGLVARWIGQVVNQRSYTLSVLYSTDNNAPKLFGGVSVNGTASVNSFGTTTLSINKYYNGFLVFNPSASLSVYLDGKLDAINTTSIPASIYNSTSPLWLGNFYGLSEASNYYSLRGGIECAALWNRALSNAEIQALNENIYQIYQPRIARFISIPSTGVTFQPAWARLRSLIIGSGV